MNVSNFPNIAYDHDAYEQQVRDPKQQKVQDSNQNFELSTKNNGIVHQQNNINFNLGKNGGDNYPTASIVMGYEHKGQQEDLGYNYPTASVVMRYEHNINYNPEVQADQIKISDQNSLKTGRTVIISQPEKKTFIGNLINLGKKFCKLWQKHPWKTAAYSFTAAGFIVGVISIALATAGIFPAAVIMAKVCYALYGATAVSGVVSCFKGYIDHTKKNPPPSQPPQNNV